MSNKTTAEKQKELHLNELKKLSDLRICLESFAAKETAFRARKDRQSVKELRDISSRFLQIVKTEDYAAFDIADQNLHAKIVELAGVPCLPEIWHTVWQSLAAFHRVSLRQYWNLTILYEEHDYLVEAICSGDLNAAEDAVKSHLEAVWYRIADHHGGFTENHDALQRATAYLTFNLNRNLRLTTVAKEVAFVSSGHLSRLFKQRYKMSFQAYLQMIRLQKAQELLLQTQLPVSSIARRVGYRDLSRFSEHFKRNSGLTPKQFARKANNG